MSKFITIILLSICTITVNAESVFYSSSSNNLFIPEVEIDGHMYIKGVLHLDDNGRYRVNGLTKLENVQEDLLLKINSIPCGQTDTLGRLAAYRAFKDGHKSYCLVKTVSITVEGGKILSYLFIENGVAQIITDTRNDTFRGCCLFLYSTNYANVQFGYIKDGLLVGQSALSDIDFEREYTLKVTGDDMEESFF